MNEIAKSEQAQESATSMISVIERFAARPDVDVDKLERMLAMQERIMAKDAEMQFFEAMRRVQMEIPRIKKDAVNQQTSSKYTKLETLNKAVVPVYTNAGFSLSFGTDTSPLDGYMRVTCDVSHIAGHTKHYQVDLPLDGSGIKGNQNKTGTHAAGSTMSYGRRYLTLLIFNVAMDDDNDGNGDNENPVTEFQAKTIRHILEQCDDTAKGKFADMYGEPENVPRGEFNHVVGGLRKAAQRAKQAKGA